MDQTHQTGVLPTAEGHVVAWEAWGNRDAPALILLHGGPGGGISDGLRALFDPAEWYLVAMDQRGCGRSRPHAGTDLAALDANTTAHLVADIERLRVALGLTSWAVFGGSWGVTLAQVYAHAHPDRVRGLLLTGITQTSQGEIDWLYGHVGALLPGPFAAFQDGARSVARGRALVQDYLPLLRDPATAQDAADAWCAWEAAVISGDPRHAPAGRFADPTFRLCFARLCAHYFSELAWIEPALATRASALGKLPGELLHSALDLSTPLSTAWHLDNAWPGARLTVLPGGLHSAAEPALADDLRAAAAWLRARLHPGPGPLAEA